MTKAGRFVGLADCYAAIVLADNATFLLAVNRTAALRRHSAIITYVIISCRGSAGRALVPQSCGRGFESHLGQDFFHMFVSTSEYTVGAELSSLGFGREGNSETAQP